MGKQRGMKIKESGSNSLGILLGTVFMTLAIFIAGSLFSYSPEDPSLNNVTDTLPKNIFWEPGAYTADLLLQLFGFASLFIVLVLFSWSIHKLFSIEIKHLWMRFIFSLLSLCIGSLLLSKYIQNSEVPFASYGGAIGNVLSIYTISYSNEYLFYGIITAFIVSAYLSLGISMNSWVFSFNFTSKHIIRLLISTKYIGQGIVSGFKYLYGLFPKKEHIVENTDDITMPKFEPQRESVKKEISKPKPKKSTFGFGLNKTNKYKLPSPDFLNVFKKFKGTYSDSELRSKADDLIKVLNDFGVRGEITSCSPGPVVTLFEFEPVAGTKSSRVIGLADDIARTMKAVSTRIAVIPGKNSLGIELPNKTREVVYIRGVVESGDYKDTHCKLPLILGKDIAGENIIADLSSIASFACCWYYWFW